MPLTKPPAVMLTFFHRYGPVAPGGVAVSAGAGAPGGRTAGARFDRRAPAAPTGRGHTQHSEQRDERERGGALREVKHPRYLQKERARTYYAVARRSDLPSKKRAIFWGFLRAISTRARLEFHDRQYLD